VNRKAHVKGIVIPHSFEDVAISTHTALNLGIAVSPRPPAVAEGAHKPVSVRERLIGNGDPMFGIRAAKAYFRRRNI
jgi:hypothetical protein